MIRRKEWAKPPRGGGFEDNSLVRRCDLEGVFVRPSSPGWSAGVGVALRQLVRPREKNNTIGLVAFAGHASEVRCGHGMGPWPQQRLHPEPRRPRPVARGNLNGQSTGSGGVDDGSVARESSLVDLTAMRFQAGPRNFESNVPNPDRCRGGEYFFVGIPERQCLARRRQATKGDEGIEYGGRLVATIEPTLDGVSAQRRDEIGGGAHVMSFPRGWGRLSPRALRRNMTETVLYETHGHVAVITINRPQARNAINLATAQGLDEALTTADNDDQVRVAVLTGAEDKAFSAGMDLKAFAQGEMPFTAHGFAGVVEHPFAKPLIGAANGAALAGGFEVLLSCDLIIAADHALFGIPEVQRGLFAGAGGLLRLPRRIPRAVAAQMAFSGDPITAQRAYELGLVNDVVPSAEVLTAALTLATRIASNAPLAVRTTKEVLRDTMDVSEVEGWRLSKAAFERIAASEDALEGAVAFAQKRAPLWRGR